MASVQELDSQSLEFRCADELAFIVVHNEVLAGVNESEVLGSLHNQVDAVLHIEHEGRGPVHHVVDVALGGGTDDEVVMAHAHVHNTLSEIKIFIHFMETVVHCDLVVFIENSFNVCP